MSLLTSSTHPIFVKLVHSIAQHAPITQIARLATHLSWPFCTLTVFVTCATCLPALPAMQTITVWLVRVCWWLSKESA